MPKYSTQTFYIHPSSNHSIVFPILNNKKSQAVLIKLIELTHFFHFQLPIFSLTLAKLHNLSQEENDHQEQTNLKIALTVFYVPRFLYNRTISLLVIYRKPIDTGGLTTSLFTIGEVNPYTIKYRCSLFVLLRVFCV